MSSVSRRPRVKCISSAVVEAAVIGCVTAVGTLVANAIRTLDAANREAGLRAMQTLPTKTRRTILPVSSIRAQLPTVTEGIRQELLQQKLPPVESARLTTLLTMQTAPYFCEPAALKAPLQNLMQARTEAQVEVASRRVINTMQDGHQWMVTNALVTACRKASIQAGFQTIETAAGVDGILRLIATDTAGRALVSEIHSDMEHEPSIETEVVGVTDGSCVAILDQFDRALEEQGMRATPKDRKWTGGVCELESAKQFLKKTLSPSSSSRDASNDFRRTRRLNLKPKLKLR